MPLADRETFRILGVDPARTRKEMLWRLSAPMRSLVAQGAARWTAPDVVELVLNDDELASGGYATIAMNRHVRCKRCSAAEDCARCEGNRAYLERVSVWITIPANVTEGTELSSHSDPFEFVEPVRFVARHDR